MQPARFAAARLAVDLQIFEKLDEAADASVSVEHLASTTGADAALLGRSHFLPYWARPSCLVLSTH